MNQNKRVTLLVVLAIIAVVAVLGIAVYAFQPASTNGSITITGASYQTGMDAAVNTLRATIADAEARRDETDVGDVGTKNWWATPQVHNTFQIEIDKAKAMLNAASVYSQGDTFELDINIAGNTGFTAMMFKLGLPPQLELIKAEPKDAAYVNGFYCPSFIGPLTWDPGMDFAVNPPMTNSDSIVMGWGGRETGSFLSNGVLLTLTLRVRDDATAGVAPLTIAFANNLHGSELPTNMTSLQNTQELTMSLQGTTITNANRDQIIPIGNVRIVN